MLTLMFCLGSAVLILLFLVVFLFISLRREIDKRIFFEDNYLKALDAISTYKRKIFLQRKELKRLYKN